MSFYLKGVDYHVLSRSKRKKILPQTGDRTGYPGISVLGRHDSRIYVLGRHNPGINVLGGHNPGINALGRHDPGISVLGGHDSGWWRTLALHCQGCWPRLLMGRRGGGCAWRTGLPRAHADLVSRSLRDARGSPPADRMAGGTTGAPCSSLPSLAVIVRRCGHWGVAACMHRRFGVTHKCATLGPLDPLTRWGGHCAPSACSSCRCHGCGVPSSLSVVHGARNSTQRLGLWAQSTVCGGTGGAP